MRRLFTPTVLALVVMVSLVAPLRAGQITGTLEGDATLTATGTPGVFTQNFTGDGDDTTYGAFTPSSTSTVDFSSPPNIVITDGMLALVFSQGHLYGTGSGSGTANGNGTATVTIDFLVTGGTELFAGATGDVTITAMITSTGATTESVTGTYVGTLQVVPEPSAVTLLAPAAAVGAVVLVRTRKRKDYVEES